MFQGRRTCPLDVCYSIWSSLGYDFLGHTNIFLASAYVSGLSGCVTYTRWEAFRNLHCQSSHDGITRWPYWSTFFVLFLISNTNLTVMNSTTVHQLRFTIAQESRWTYWSFSRPSRARLSLCGCLDGGAKLMVAIYVSSALCIRMVEQVEHTEDPEGGP